SELQITLGGKLSVARRVERDSGILPAVSLHDLGHLDAGTALGAPGHEGARGGEESIRAATQAHRVFVGHASLGWKAHEIRGSRGTDSGVHRVMFYVRAPSPRVARTIFGICHQRF